MAEIFWYVDSGEKARYAGAGENFPDAYLPEILSSAGICGKELSAWPAPDGSVVFIGECAAENKELLNFVRRGGTLISFASSALDDFFNVSGRSQTYGEFSVTGYIEIVDGGIKPLSGRDYRLPVISAACEVTALEPGDEILAVFRAEGEERPGIVSRRCGEGRIVYFAFSLPQTLWYMCQGKPVLHDTDGDGYCRNGDAIVLDKNFPAELPYADIYKRLLINILSEFNIPVIHELPPVRDTVPGFIMHFTGDEDLCGRQMYTALNYMREKGLPYQMNLQPKLDKSGFEISKEEFLDLEARGATLSLHFDFVGLERLYTREDVKKQLELFVSEFGRLPVVANNHWLMSSGWAENARWYEEFGIKGFHNRAYIFTDPADINMMNLYAFPFGTSYPVFVYEDAAHGNRKLDVIDLMIGYYEPRCDGEEDRARLKGYMSLSAELAMIANIFVHPVYFTLDPEKLLPAMEILLDAAARLGGVALSTDEICGWWSDRSKIRIEPQGAGKYRSTAARAYIVRLNPGTGLRVNGERIGGTLRNTYGQDSVMYIIPEGENIFEIEENAL